MIPRVLRTAAGPARTNSRTASTQAVSVFDEVADFLPTLTPGARGAAPEAQVSTLSNGLRVATVDDGSHAASVGLFVEAGSRFETVKSTEGAAHLLRRSAFKSTNQRSELRLFRDLEDNGMVASASVDREHLVYRVDALRDSAIVALETVAESALDPYLPGYEIASTRNLVNLDIDEAQYDVQAVVSDMLHAAAFSGEEAPLGRSALAGRNHAASLDADALHAHRANTFAAGRATVVGTGVDHDAFVRAAESAFGGMASGSGASKAAASYTGGERRVRAVTDDAFLAVGFSTGGGWGSDQLYANLVLQVLLGGGISNNESRLVRDVANKHDAVRAASAFSAVYSDSGLVGAFGACHGSAAGDLTEAVCNTFKQAAGAAASTEELARAKNQLKATVASNLSTRGGVFSDLGTQILTTGSVASAAELFARVDAVSAKDVQGAAAALLSTKPSVAVFGDVSSMPAYNEVEAMLK